LKLFALWGVAFFTFSRRGKNKNVFLSCLRVPKLACVFLFARPLPPPSFLFFLVIPLPVTLSSSSSSQNDETENLQEAAKASKGKQKRFFSKRQNTNFFEELF